MQSVTLRGSYRGLFIIGSMAVLFASVSLAKEVDQRSQIILLNDSAAALEDSNPQMAKDLTQFADEKEKALDDKITGEDTPPVPDAEEIKKQQTDRIKLLKDSAAMLQPTYPEIAKSLMQMADGMAQSVEVQKK